MITYSLVGMRQARYRDIVRPPGKHEFEDHSRAIWDATSTICRETATKAWIQRSLTV